jgi:ADP-ribose pyrophosphatase
MEETISSKLIVKGKNFSFHHDTVRLPNGKETDRNIVKHPGAVAIIAIQDEEIVLINQYRYATGKYLLEVPAGTLELGEDPFQCAVRELLEETGYAASSWLLLFKCYMVPGYSDEIIYFFLAEGLTRIEVDPDEDESIEVQLFRLYEVLNMIERNEIEDAKTMIGVLWYLTGLNLYSKID